MTTQAICMLINLIEIPAKMAESSKFETCLPNPYLTNNNFRVVMSVGINFDRTEPKRVLKIYSQNCTE